MALTYMIATTTFATLCSLVWLMTGGSVIAAVALYLVSGNVAMCALVARSALMSRSHTANS